MRGHVRLSFYVLELVAACLLVIALVCISQELRPSAPPCPPELPPRAAAPPVRSGRALRDSSGATFTHRADPERVSSDKQPSFTCGMDSGSFSCGECISHLDCATSQACIADSTSHRTRCVSSDCESDDDCRSGRCLLVGNSDVTRCSPLGSQQLNDECSTKDPCAIGLVCAFGVCRVPCVFGGKCAQGECTATDEGLACVVPPVVTGADCSATDACRTGEGCIVHGYGHTWSGTCLPRCPCLSDEVCGSFAFTEGFCFEACLPQDPFTCPEGTICGNVDERGTTWGCLPR